MKNISPSGRLVERLLYILSTYSFTIEHKRSGEIDMLTIYQEMYVLEHQQQKNYKWKETQKITQFRQSSFNKETLTQ